MCMCVCLYVCIYVYMDVCVYVCMYACMGRGGLLVKVFDKTPLAHAVYCLQKYKNEKKKEKGGNDKCVSV